MAQLAGRPVPVGVSVGERPADEGGLKAHVALDHAGHLSAFVTVTDGRTPDIEVARTLKLPKGQHRRRGSGVCGLRVDQLVDPVRGFLVTRLKKRVGYRVLERREVDRSQGVTSDQTIEFSSARGRKRCPHRLRRIGYRDREAGRHYAFLTTNFALAAKTIADIYRSRWQKAQIRTSCHSFRLRNCT